MPSYDEWTDYELLCKLYDMYYIDEEITKAWDIGFSESMLDRFSDLINETYKEGEEPTAEYLSAGRRTQVIRILRRS